MKILYQLTVIFLIIHVNNVIGSEFPSNIKRCHYAESECIARSMEYVMRNYGVSGLKDIGLIPFEPLHVKSLKLERNPTSPVNIELAFRNVDVIGLSSARITRVNGFTADPNESMEFEMVSAKTILRGPYTIDGNVLILPIVGKGNSEIILENVVYTLKTKNKGLKKNGKDYFDLEAVRLEIKPRRVQFRLEGLFNGNKELGDNMNKFINENWSEIFGELQLAVSEAFALILKHIFTNVFAKYPYEYFFEHETS